jgi:hypothetical protein
MSLGRVCLAIRQPILNGIVREALRGIPGLVLQQSDRPLEELLGTDPSHSVGVLIAEAGTASVDEVRKLLLATPVADRLLLLSDHCRSAHVLGLHVTVRSLGSIAPRDLREEVRRLLARDDV